MRRCGTCVEVCRAVGSLCRVSGRFGAFCAPGAPFEGDGMRGFVPAGPEMLESA